MEDWLYGSILPKVVLIPSVKGMICGEYYVKWLADEENGLACAKIYRNGSNDHGEMGSLGQMGIGEAAFINCPQSNHCIESFVFLNT